VQCKFPNDLCYVLFDCSMSLLTNYPCCCLFVSLFISLFFNRRYEHNHQEKMGTRSLSQLLGNTLYYRRFFPYYAFNILGGLDEEGKGAVYGYDAVGSFQRQPDGISANGSAMKLIMPLLDNIVGFKNRTDGDRRAYTAEEAVELVKEGFVTAGERDINCGDAVEIKVITKDGITTEIFALKRD